MKLFRNLGKYPFMMLLSLSAIILTVAAYLGRNSVYADYSADFVNYPRLTVVFEGIKDKKYPWEVLTDQNNKKDSAYNSAEEASPTKNSDSLSENSSEETAANSTQTSHSKPPVKDNSAHTAPAADGTGKGDGSNSSDTSSRDSKASGTMSGDNKTSDPMGGDSTDSNTENGDSKGSNTKGGDNKASDPMNGDNKGSDTKSGDSKNTDPKNGDNKGSDTKSGDNKNTDSKNGDSKGSDSKSGDKNTGTKGGDSKGSGTKNGDSKTSDTKGEDNAAHPFKGFTVVNEDYFDDALFIGDSRTVGLSEYSGWKKPAFYSDIGLTIYDVFDKKIAKVGGKTMTIKDALHKKSFRKIYIMLGINEMGTGNAKTFTKAYKDVVEQLKELQPDAIIYVEAIMNVAKEKSDQDPIFNNTNIGKRNKHLATLADNKRVFYIDVNEVITDSTGGIPAKYTFDNIHLKAAYYKIWTDFLLQHGVELQ